MLSLLYNFDSKRVKLTEAAALSEDDEDDDGPYLEPVDLKLLKTVKLPAEPVSVCHINGITYAGLENNLLVKISQNDGTFSPFLELDSAVSAVHVYGNEIYVLLHKMNQVRVYDLDGEYVRSWIHDSGYNGYCKLRVTNLGVVIPCATKRALTVYDLHGNKIKDILCPLICNQRPGLLALALNGDKHLLVSSCPSLYVRPAVCNVNLESGEVVWTTELSEPRGVVCYRDKFVLVANYGYYGHEMDVLELENGELFITHKTAEH